MRSPYLLTLCGLLACQDPPPPPPLPEVEAPQPLPEPEPGSLADLGAPEPESEPGSLADQGALEARDYLSPVPEGMVDVCELEPALRCQIAYHTPDNFVGSPLPGYGAPAAWMLDAPSAALLRVHQGLAEQGWGLLVFDAYRPIRGTLAMVAWAERTEQAHLLNGYIARRSGHNHGHTVDLTLYDLATGEVADMGCPFDTLDERAHTSNAEGEVLARRMVLVQAMKAEGFRNYSKEWWHHRMPMEGTQPRDVPYGCFEAPEGSWEPVEGWNQPGYEPPMAWQPAPCAAPDLQPQPGSTP